MIRINLIGVAPTPKVTKPAGPPATTALMAMIFVGALLVTSLAVAISDIVLTSAIKRDTDQLNVEKAREGELAAAERQYLNFQQQKRDLETHINTIQTLQNSRVGPVELMAALGNTVNHTTDLYLLTVTPSGTHFAINGISNSVESIAKFIGDLKRSGSFPEVQMQRYYQDDMTNRVAFKFNLDVVFKPSTPPPAPPAQPAGTPGRRAGM